VSTYDRFWFQVDRSGGPDSCWPWLGPCNPDGIGVFLVHGRKTTARRYAYRMHFEDPGPLRIGVRCGTVSCCNWRHMRARTARQVATGNGSAAAVNAAATACPRRHPLGAANTYVHADGRRECRTCKAGRGAPRHTGGDDGAPGDASARPGRDTTP
jgi:hypothetical protein